MNLIEQLGVETCKALRAIPAEAFDSHGIKFSRKELECALLQYRREHDIYVAGDLVVCIFGQDSTFLTKGEIYTVKEVCYGGTHVTLKLQENYDGGESSYSVNRFNHATDAEIKANRRVEVG